MEMSNTTQGILFDKDGTLLDFFSIWVPVTNVFADKIAAEALGPDAGNEQKSKLITDVLRSLGIENGTANPDGMLAAGTVGEIKEALTDILKKSGIKTIPSALDRIEQFYLVEASRHRELIKPPVSLKALKELLSGLKKSGIKIGLATSDTLESSLLCLKSMEILEYFDYLGADDGKTAHKPDAAIMKMFCRQTGLTPDQVWVVGDTPRDIRFARNAGARGAAAVLSGAGGKDDLSDADILLKDITCIIEDGRLVLP